MFSFAYRDADLLFEFIDIRMLQQEERLQELRKSIQGIMSQIQDCLDGLDNMDENAKVTILEFLIARAWSTPLVRLN